MAKTSAGGGSGVLPSPTMAVQSPYGGCEVPTDVRRIARRLQALLDNGDVTVDEALVVVREISNSPYPKQVLASMASIQMRGNEWMVVGLEHPNDPPSGETEGYLLSEQ